MHPQLALALNQAGELGKQIQHVDWVSVVGVALDDWPDPLALNVALLLSTPLPMLLYLGPRRVVLFNEAACPVLELRENIQGLPMRQVWEPSTEYERLTMLGKQVLKDGGTFFCNDVLIPRLHRGTRPIEAYFRFSCSAVTIPVSSLDDIAQNPLVISPLSSPEFILAAENVGTGKKFDRDKWMEQVGGVIAAPQSPPHSPNPLLQPRPLVQPQFIQPTETAAAVDGTASSSSSCSSSDGSMGSATATSANKSSNIVMEERGVGYVEVVRAANRRPLLGSPKSSGKDSATKPDPVQEMYEEACWNVPHHAGLVGFMMCFADTTREIVGERRLTTLTGLSSALVTAATPQSVLQIALDHLQRDTALRDVHFCTAYAVQQEPPSVAVHSDVRAPGVVVAKRVSDRAPPEDPHTAPLHLPAWIRFRHDHQRDDAVTPTPDTELSKAIEAAFLTGERQISILPHASGIDRILLILPLVSKPALLPIVQQMQMDETRNRMASGSSALNSVSEDGVSNPSSPERKASDPDAATCWQKSARLSQPDFSAVNVDNPRHPCSKLAVEHVLVVLTSQLRDVRIDKEYQDYFGLLSLCLSHALCVAASVSEDKERLEKLVAVNQLKADFLCNVSHELQTPLQLILGPLTDVLAEDDAAVAAPPSVAASSSSVAATGPVLTPKVRGVLDSVHRNAKRLHRLVATLLDFSRMKLGHQSKPLELDIAALTQSLASRFESTAQKLSVGLAVDTPPTPLMVTIDASYWEKVLLNLLSNAFKFTSTGKVTIGVRPNKANDGVVATVRDTGIGIPSEYLPQIFERFFSFRDARARSTEGSGIGLALVKELLFAMGGTISVESAVGFGTCFTVELPQHPPTAPSVSRPAEAPNTQSDSEQDGLQQMSSSTDSLLLFPPDLDSSFDAAAATDARADKQRENPTTTSSATEMPKSLFSAAVVADTKLHAPKHQRADHSLSSKFDERKASSKFLSDHSPHDEPFQQSESPASTSSQLVADSDSGGTGIAPSESTSSTGSISSGRPRVLVVDENADMRLYLQRLLEPAFEVKLESTHDGALNCSSMCAPDLIIADAKLMSPGGRSIIRELRSKRTHHIPILLLSPLVNEDAATATLEAGADDFLSKPFSSRELLARVAIHARLSRLRQVTAQLTKRRARRDRALLDISRTVSAAFQNHHEALSFAARKIREIVGCDRVLLGSFTENLNQRRTGSRGLASLEPSSTYVDSDGSSVSTIGSSFSSSIAVAPIESGSGSDFHLRRHRSVEPSREGLVGHASAPATIPVAPDDSLTIPERNLKRHSSPSLPRIFLQPNKTKRLGHLTHPTIQHLQQETARLTSDPGLLTSSSSSATTATVTPFHTAETRTMKIVAECMAEGPVRLSAVPLLDRSININHLRLHDEFLHTVSVNCEEDEAIARFADTFGLGSSTLSRDARFILCDESPSSAGAENTREESDRSSSSTPSLNAALAELGAASTDSVNEQGSSSSFSSFSPELQSGCSMTFPIVVRGQPWGLLACLCFHPRSGVTCPGGCGWALDDVDFARQVATQVGIAIAKAQDEEERISRAEAVRTAEASSRAKSVFLASVSHEIRTPATSIVGLAELLLLSELNSEQREILSTLHRASEVLSVIIEDILDISRIEAGKLTLSNSWTNAYDLVDNVLKFFSEKAQSKNITLIADSSPYLPPAVMCDPDRLRQVLLNIVGNAIKFTETGEVVVKVWLVADKQAVERDDESSNAGPPPGPTSDGTSPRAPRKSSFRLLGHNDSEISRSQAQQHKLFFKVADTGIGMEKSAIQRIFDAFSQLDTSVSRRHDGLGLGLAISKQLVELAGGALSVSSQLGIGSTFTFTWPVQQIDYNPAPISPDKAKPRQGSLITVSSNSLTHPGEFTTLTTPTAEDLTTTELPSTLPSASSSSASLPPVDDSRLAPRDSESGVQSGSSSDDDTLKRLHLVSDADMLAPDPISVRIVLLHPHAKARRALARNLGMLRGVNVVSCSTIAEAVLALDQASCLDDAAIVAILHSELMTPTSTAGRVLSAAASILAPAIDGQVPALPPASPSQDQIRLQEAVSDPNLVQAVLVLTVFGNSQMLGRASALRRDAQVVLEPVHWPTLRQHISKAFERRENRTSPSPAASVNTSTMSLTAVRSTNSPAPDVPMQFLPLRLRQDLLSSSSSPTVSTTALKKVEADLDAVAPLPTRIVGPVSPLHLDNSARTSASANHDLSATTRMLQRRTSSEHHLGDVGELEVELTPPHGGSSRTSLPSVVTTPLPSHFEHSPLQTKSSPADGTSAPAEEDGVGFRPYVLLVEDNVTNQRVFQKQLEKLGCSVVIASNGLQALIVLKQGPVVPGTSATDTVVTADQTGAARRPFDMIFMDCNMPVLDGFSATKIIREVFNPPTSEIPIIALTANAMLTDRAECLAAGMTDFLAKPTRLSDFKHTIERHCPLPPSASGLDKSSIRLPTPGTQTEPQRARN